MSTPDRQSELVALISESQTRLLAYVYSLTANRQLAEEIVQATNLVIWKKADTFEPGTNFIAWAFKIARLQVLEHRNKAGRDAVVFGRELVDELAAQAAESNAFEDLPERQQALADCVAELPPSRQELLWLRYRDSLSLPDVAGRIGKSSNATAVLLHRIRQLLLDCIQRRMAACEGLQ